MESKKISCDPANTERIIELLKTLKENRDEKWDEEFLKHIASACFSESLPQIIIGSDSFPYFVLNTNEHYNPFELYFINKLKDTFLLENGVGVIINPLKNNSEWTFTYGDILNLHLNKEFITKNITSDLPDQNLNQIDTNIQYSHPSKNYLPIYTRNLLKKYLNKIGVKNPKVMLINIIKGNFTSQELVFNISINDFSTE